MNPKVSYFFFMVKNSSENIVDDGWVGSGKNFRELGWVQKRCVGFGKNHLGFSIIGMTVVPKFTRLLPKPETQTYLPQPYATTGFQKWTTSNSSSSDPTNWLPPATIPV